MSVADRMLRQLREENKRLRGENDRLREMLIRRRSEQAREVSSRQRVAVFYSGLPIGVADVFVDKFNNDNALMEPERFVPRQQVRAPAVLLLGESGRVENDVAFATGYDLSTLTSMGVQVVYLRRGYRLRPSVRQVGANEVIEVGYRFRPTEFVADERGVTYVQRKLRISP